MESCLELLTEARKHRTDAEMLKGTKDKAEREAGEASIRVDIVERRAEDVEVALKETVEENFRLEEKIKEFKA